MTLSKGQNFPFFDSKNNEDIIIDCVNKFI